MKNSYAFISLAVAALLLLVACTTTRNSSHKPLAGSVFRIVTLNGQPVAASDGEEAFTIAFLADKQVSAYVGCNRIFASYREKADGRLTFDHAGCTQMLCPDMEVEDAFLRAFNQVTGYETTATGVNFLSASGDVLFQGEKQ
ncbi:MAG: META domain-containing protein [Bacteroidaceae bacterium]|nr:META domain-containing protein [Bacteroidaceae bacterium]